MINQTEHIQILGGGPAGLAVAYHAAKSDLPFTLFEATDQVGGNCRTLRIGDFLFDTGAHRLHDRDDEVTAELRELLGDDLARVSAPSQIYTGGRYVDFPLYFGDIVKKLEPRELVRIALENIAGAMRRGEKPATFEALAIATYGPTLAKRFLLNYSEKLWGKPCSQLSPRVAGNRLKGLNAATFIIRSLLGRDADGRHLDGSFYYPRHGIGEIAGKMAGVIGEERIRYGSRITAIRHDGDAIRSILLNDTEEIAAGRVVSSLPLTRMLAIMDPPPPPSIMKVAGELTYRHLLLAIFCLDREKVSDNASIYFPDAAEPYTRIYESKNRSRMMAPPGQTSIVVEIPCALGDEHWRMNEEEIRRMLIPHLRRSIGLREEEIVAFGTHRIPYAYPVLEVGFEERARQLIDYASRFRNLHLTGRSALFQYVHIHDLLALGRRMVDDLRFTIDD
jgi:protoporphyrinogen oxidase